MASYRKVRVMQWNGHDAVFDDVVSYTKGGAPHQSGAAKNGGAHSMEKRASRRSSTNWRSVAVTFPKGKCGEKSLKVPRLPPRRSVEM